MRKAGDNNRLVLKFPQRLALVESVSLTRMQARLVDVSEHPVQGSLELPWPDWHGVMPKTTGLDARGCVRNWSYSYPAETLRQFIVDKAKTLHSECTEFNGYLTLKMGRFVVEWNNFEASLQGKETVYLRKMPPARVMNMANVFEPKPVYCLPAVKLPYAMDQCWTDKDFLALTDLDAFLSFLDGQMGQVADPFRWTVKKKLEEANMNGIPFTVKSFGGGQGLLSALGQTEEEFDDREEIIIEEEEIPWPKF